MTSTLFCTHVRRLGLLLTLSFPVLAGCTQPEPSAESGETESSTDSSTGGSESTGDGDGDAPSYPDYPDCEPRADDVPSSWAYLASDSWETLAFEEMALDILDGGRCMVLAANESASGLELELDCVRTRDQTLHQGTLQILPPEAAAALVGLVGSEIDLSFEPGSWFSFEGAPNSTYVLRDLQGVLLFASVNYGVSQTGLDELGGPLFDTQGFGAPQTTPEQLDDWLLPFALPRLVDELCAPEQSPPLLPYDLSRRFAVEIVDDSGPTLTYDGNRRSLTINGEGYELIVSAAQSEWEWSFVEAAHASVDMVLLRTEGG